MHRRHLLAGLTATAALPFAARAAATDGAAHAQDIGWLIDTMATRYAYLPDRHIDLAKLRGAYVPAARAAPDRQAFLPVLERFLAEFHDHHIGPNTNNDDSPQLVPTGAEMWASFRDGRAILEAVRQGSPAEAAGMRAGDEVVSLGGVPIHEAVATHGPRCLSAPDAEADDYTLRVLLAGTHRGERVIGLAGGFRPRSVTLAPHTRGPDLPPLTVSTLASGVVHLRVENSLGDSDLITAFDAAMDAARNARSIILDLRNTPSGGDTDVAEPMMGRFIDHEQPYQRIFDPAPGKSVEHDSWLKTVKPHGSFVARMPLVVLVDRWTGSMGEGMAIGLDAMKRGKVVGTQMAGLCGAIEGFRLPASGIGVNVSTERLYHLDGTPRERWTPPITVDLATAAGDDLILARGLEALKA